MAKRKIIAAFRDKTGRAVAWAKGPKSRKKRITEAACENLVNYRKRRMNIGDVDAAEAKYKLYINWIPEGEK
jgi:hypothetical protein